MALVTMPLGSFDASGSVAGAIVFSKWKGRNYVRRLVKPSNPKSGPQVGVRSMFKFLAQNWAGLTAPEQATWQPLADAAVVSPFNAYMSSGQKRWRNFLPPGQEIPITETGTPGTNATWLAAAGVRQITLTSNLMTLGDNWGRLIFKGDTGFSTAFSNCIAIILLDVVSTNVEFVDTPLIAGSFFYNARDFTDDGVLGAELGEVTATVT